MASNRILIVDDEEAIREVWYPAFWKPRATSAPPRAMAREALEVLKDKSFDLVLSDMVMPEMDGMQLLRKLQEKDQDLPVVMVTAMHDLSTAIDAIRHGAYDYILKPFEKNQLFLSISRALEHRRVVVEKPRLSSTIWRSWWRKRTGEKLRQALNQLEQSYDQTRLQALGRALDFEGRRNARPLQARHRLHHGHCQGHTHIDPAMLPQIARAAFLHEHWKNGDSRLTSCASRVRWTTTNAPSCAPTAKSATTW